MRRHLASSLLVRRPTIGRSFVDRYGTSTTMMATRVPPEVAYDLHQREPHVSPNANTSEDYKTVERCKFDPVCTSPGLDY